MPLSAHFLILLAMYKFEGTPGPWTECHTYCNSILIEGEDGGVCQVVSDNDDTTEINHADAKLISSAPELLEALKSLMAAYEKDGHLLNFNVDTARQAIHKALGKEVQNHEDR